MNRDKREATRRTILRFSTLIFLLAVAEFFGRRADPILFAPPSQILDAFWELLITGKLLKALGDSLLTLLLGFVFGAIPGIALGLFMGRFKLIERIFSPYVYALYATPLVALVPLVIIWFGTDLSGRVVYVALWVIFPILVNTSMGVNQANADLLEVGRSFGASELQIIRHIIWPYTVPYIVSSLRLAVGRGIVGMVVAEMSLRLTGLGGMLMEYSASMATDVVLMVVLVLLCFGAGLTEFVKFLERVIAPWRTQAERE
jgi:NitT/TauT family transport system permease protein